MKSEDRINELFKELVPRQGAAETVAGEIIRAVVRIRYRWWNDGDRAGVGYGKETVNPAVRYIRAIAERCVDESEELTARKYCSRIIEEMCVYLLYDPVQDDTYGGAYDIELDRLEDEILNLLELFPELKEEKNTDDMWNHVKKEEDWDDSEFDDDNESVL